MSCLIFECAGQYNLLRRGESSPYDSAVAIEISEYRKIRLKVLTGDSLARAMELHAAFTDTLVARFEATIQTLTIKNTRHEATITEKNKTIADLSAGFDNLATLSKRLRIFKNPTLDGLAKFAGGALLGYLIAK